MKINKLRFGLLFGLFYAAIFQAFVFLLWPVETIIWEMMLIILSIGAWILGLMSTMFAVVGSKEEMDTFIEEIQERFFEE